jgi:hypothetical protein
MRTKRLRGLILGVVLLVAATSLGTSPLNAAAPPVPRTGRTAGGSVWDKLADLTITVADSVCRLFGYTLFNVYTSDPNVRMTQLLNQSEDLRQIGLEWQRIWFADQKALTPERVHENIQ